MPVSPTYPGVYVEEIPSGVRTIVGVATSITAFIGRAVRGPIDQATTLNSFGDFEREFGGLWAESTLGFAVRDFYLNGGSQAIVVRLFNPTFANDADQEAAKNAADAVAGAVKSLANAITEAANEANKFPDKPEPIEHIKYLAAQAVLTAVKTAKDDADATLDSVKAAATLAATVYGKVTLEFGDIQLRAAYPGAWAKHLRASLDFDNLPANKPTLFNLTVHDLGSGVTERFLNLDTATKGVRRADKVLAAESKLVGWNGDWPAASPNLAQVYTALEAFKTAVKNKAPQATIDSKEEEVWKLTQDTVSVAESKYRRAKRRVEEKLNQGQNASSEQTEAATAKDGLTTAEQERAASASDGLSLFIGNFLPPNGKDEKKGLYALQQADLFNLLCLPPYKDDNTKADLNLIATAATYCEERRAMLLVDAPASWKDKATAKTEFTDANEKVGTRSRNAALFFPRLKQPNPLRDNQMEEFAPCGAVAGLFARTDTQRGVWKAPAGLDATLVGVPQLSVPLTDDENGELNPLGINCLRAFPVAGRVVWGARTLRGADQLADEWKYIPVRRTALFIEESLFRALKWVVFEPNDEPLWAQIRLNVGAFMHNLFRQGAFQGQTPKDAYLVKCDKDTTTQHDINLGIVNIVVGFAPLKPAEFVIIKLQQLAGQVQS